MINRGARHPTQYAPHRTEENPIREIQTLFVENLLQLLKREWKVRTHEPDAWLAPTSVSAQWWLEASYTAYDDLLRWPGYACCQDESDSVDAAAFWPSPAGGENIFSVWMLKKKAKNLYIFIHCAVLSLNQILSLRERLPHSGNLATVHHSSSHLKQSLRYLLETASS